VLIASYLPLSLAATTSNLRCESHLRNPENVALFPACTFKLNAEVSPWVSPRKTFLPWAKTIRNSGSLLTRVQRPTLLSVPFLLPVEAPQHSLLYQGNASGHVDPLPRISCFRRKIADAANHAILSVRNFRFRKPNRVLKLITSTNVPVIHSTGVISASTHFSSEVSHDSRSG
jgi:hypothetical protein